MNGTVDVARSAGCAAGLKFSEIEAMKPRFIQPLLLVAALFTPLLRAQDAPAKVHEIEQKVLQRQYQKAVHALIESVRESGKDGAGTAPELIDKRVQWLAMVDGQIEGGGQIAAANREDTESAVALNDLAWSMITSQEAAARRPNIALKLADIALELDGGNRELEPKVRDTRARALFLLGKHGEAIAEQEKAVAAATVADEKAGFEATLAAYKRDELPEVLKEDHPGVAAAANGGPYIMGKLRTIVIPSIDFEDVTLEDAVGFLRKQSIELDTLERNPARKGVNFVLLRPTARPASAPASEATSNEALPGTKAEPDALRIASLHLRNVPLDIALKYICEVARLRYKVDDFAVTLIPFNAPEDFYSRTFHVPPDFAARLEESRSGAKAAPGDPAAGAPAGAARPPIIELLKSSGIHFAEGSAVTLSSSGMLLVRNTPTELDKIEQLIQVLSQGAVDRRNEVPEASPPGEEREASATGKTDLAPKDLRSRIEEIVALQRRIENAEKENPRSAGNEINQAKEELQKRMDELAKFARFDEAENQQSGAKHILGKLRNIIIPSIAFKDTTLDEAADFLRKQSIELDTMEPDPARKGVNLVVRLAPASGKGDGKPEVVRIKELNLRNVPLAEALRSICNVTRYRYKVDDFSVTLLSPDVPEDNLSRTFAVPPNFGSTQVPIEDLLKLCGVKFGEGALATLTSSGTLVVRNTPIELDKIEQLIQADLQARANRGKSGQPLPPAAAPAPVKKPAGR